MADLEKQLELQRQIAESTGKTLDLIRQQSREYSNLVRSAESYTRQGKQGEVHFSKLEDKLSDIVSNAAKLSKIKYGQGVKALSSAFSSVNSQVDEYIESLRESRGISRSIYDQWVKTGKVKEKIAKEVTPSLAPKMREVEAGKGPGKIMGAMKTVLSPKAGIKETSKAGGSLMEYVKAVKASNTAAGAAKTGFLGLGAALKMLTKANILFAVIGGLKALGSAINNLDKFIKTFNKSYQQFVGPAVLLKDVSSGMKDFTNAIFDMQRNIELGIGSKEVMQMIGAVSGAGLSLQGLMDRVGTYNEVIETTRKLQVEFGNSLEDMGAAVGSQMLNLRSSLEDVRDTFHNLSYDAAIAGVQSQKFYQVVESASMSLSYYGNYLDDVSSRIREFTKTGAMGFKDASEHATKMITAFKDMGVTQRRAMISAMGIEEYDKLLTKRMGEIRGRRREARAEIEAKEAKIAKAETEEEKEVLRAEIRALEKREAASRADIRRIDRALEGDITEKALAMPMIAKRTEEVVAMFLDALNVDVIKEEFTPLVGVLENIGFQAEDIYKYLNRARDVSHSIVDLSKSLGDNFEDAYKAGRGQFSKIVDIIDLYKDKDITFKDMKDQVQKQLEMTDMTKENIQKYLDVLRGSVDAAQELAKTGKPGAIEARAAEFGRAALAAPEKRGKEIEKSQLDKMVEQTTTLQKYLDIGKETMKYTLAASKPQQAAAAAAITTAKKASGLYNYVSSWYKEKVDKREFKKWTEKTAGGKGFYFEELAREEHEARMAAIDEEQKGNIEAAKEYREKAKDIGKLLQEEREKILREDSSLAPILSEIEDKIAAGKETRLEKMHRISPLGIAEEKGRELGEAFEETTKKIREMEGKKEKFGLDKEEISELKKLKDKKIKLENDIDKNLRDITELERMVPTRYFEMMQRMKMARAQALEIPEEAKGGELPSERDFAPKTPGWVKVSPNDLVIDSTEIAKGLSMNAGGLINSMGGGTNQTNMGGVTLNFNAPLNGRPEEYRTLFIDAVEQIVDRRMYKAKQRA